MSLRCSYPVFAVALFGHAGCAIEWPSGQPKSDGGAEDTGLPTPVLDAAAAVSFDSAALPADMDARLLPPANEMDAGDAGAGSDNDDSALDAGPNEPLPVDAGLWAAATHNFAFITSTEYTGALGGIAGADTICADRARAGGLPGNSWRALLSKRGAPAKNRLTGAHDWVRSDLRDVADEPGQLFEYGATYPISFDEFGRNTPPNTRAWSGSDHDGSAWPDGACNDWTSESSGLTGFWGASDISGRGWLRAASSPCSQTFHVYCFSVDRGDTRVLPDAPPRKRVFVSTRVFVPGGTSAAALSRADALCQADACTLGQLGACPGDVPPTRTFGALLATSLLPAAERFPGSGRGWSALHGETWLENASDLRSGLPLVGATRDPASAQVVGGITGSAGAAGSYDNSCADWTSTAGNAIGGSANAAGVRAFGWSSPTCADGGRVYCLER